MPTDTALSGMHMATSSMQDNSASPHKLIDCLIRQHTQAGALIVSMKTYHRTIGMPYLKASAKWNEDGPALTFTNVP